MGDLGVRRAAGLERVLRMHSVERGRGPPAFDPQLLISSWVYSYSVGLGSAREIARRCEWDPAFQWLTGGEAVNDHTLVDSRVEPNGNPLFSGPSAPWAVPSPDGRHLAICE